MSLRALKDAGDLFQDLVASVRLCNEARNRSAATWAAREAEWREIAAADDAKLATLLPGLSLPAKKRVRDACKPLVAILGPLHAEAVNLPANDVSEGP